MIVVWSSTRHVTGYRTAPFKVVRVTFIIGCLVMSLCDVTATAQQSKTREGIITPSAEAPAAGVAERLSGRLAPYRGELIYLRIAGRPEVLGRFIATSADGIMVSIGGVEQRISIADIDEISRRGDSLRNGLLIGAASGLAVGYLSLQGASCYDCATARAQVVIGLGFGSAIGAWLDHRRVGRTRLYSR